MTTEFLPSFLMSEIYFCSKHRPGFLPERLRAAIEDGFFQCAEIGMPASDKDACSIGAMVRDSKIGLIQWMTEYIDLYELDISTLDEPRRLHSVEQIKSQLPAAVRCGASSIAVICGADPGEYHRNAGFDAFLKSMTAIIRAATDAGLSVLLEPLDRFAHKKRLLGPTKEVVPLLEKLHLLGAPLWMAFDSAHAALNEECLTHSLQRAHPFLRHIHLSNAVLDKDDQDYGDWHLPPGSPGFLTKDTAASILRTLSNEDTTCKTRLTVAVEARGGHGVNEDLLMRQTADFLKAVLADVHDDTKPVIVE